MVHPKDLSIADFSYVLPQERIAQEPLSQRDESKLLICKYGNISEDGFFNIANYFPEKSTLVFNDTKVIHARIIFKNENDANIEVFLLEPVEPFRDMQLAIFQHGECTWRCLVGNAKKWREDSLTRKIRVGEEKGELLVQRKGKIEEDFLIHFSWKPQQLSFARVLEAAGFVPLPPYIKRKAAYNDEDRYQTLYAFQDGSVAAPTAGLHFTERVFDQLHQKKIQSQFVTLHVGAGTFLPVKSQHMSGHQMHSEQFVVRKETIESLIGRKDQPLIAVGTTSCRTLESLYWLGLQLIKGKENWPAYPFVDQWEPYETNADSGFTICLDAVLKYMKKNKLSQLIGETKLIIAPGYKFRLVDGLITNFHLPQSTLLLLIAAFIGDDWRKVYDYALKHDFRFLSYGDGSLLWRNGR